MDETRLLKRHDARLDSSCCSGMESSVVSWAFDRACAELANNYSAIEDQGKRALHGLHSQQFPGCLEQEVPDVR